MTSHAVKWPGPIKEKAVTHISWHIVYPDMELKPGSPLDAIDSEQVWNEATVIESNNMSVRDFSCAGSTSCRFVLPALPLVCLLPLFDSLHNLACYDSRFRVYLISTRFLLSIMAGQMSGMRGSCAEARDWQGDRCTHRQQSAGLSQP